MGDNEDGERKLRVKGEVSPYGAKQPVAVCLAPTEAERRPEPGKPVSAYPLCGARICFRASQLYSPRNAPRYVVSFLGDIGYPSAGLDMDAGRDGAISGDGD